jgi:Fe-S-cluster containining protein
VYRLVITLVAPGTATQGSAWRAYAVDAAVPFASAACVWGDETGERAESEGRAAIERHVAATGVNAEVEVVRERREATGDGAAALARLAALTDELDAVQAAARDAYPAEVSCKRGCDSCCHQQVGVSRVEAARLAAAVAALSGEARAALQASVARAAALDRPRCGALDDGGGCQLYGARPVVCRSHGLVYVTYRRTRGSSLPVLHRSCSLNYNGQMPAADAQVYDFAAWRERLMAIDEAFAEETGVGADLAVGPSIALAEVLAAIVD